MLDSQDPNDVRNYSPEDIAKALPASDSVIKEIIPDSEHPLIKSLLTLIQVYPHIDTWTLLNDKLSQSVEIRIKLFHALDVSSGSSNSHKSHTK